MGYHVDMKKVIILCEEGWQGVRELSLELAKRRIGNVVLIKGDPGREVRKFITKHPLIWNIFFPRLLFRVRLPSTILFIRLFSGSKICIWSRERTRKLIDPYCKISGVKLIYMLEEGNQILNEEMRKNILEVVGKIESESR